MSGENNWDVWLLGFEPDADPTTGLVQLFGMTEAAAQHIEMTLPRAMKRKLSHEEASNMLGALERIGAKAELRQHRKESARRSVSRPKMEAVRNPAPAPANTAAGSAPPSDRAPPPTQPTSAAPGPGSNAPTPGAPAASESAPAPKPIELPLGAPVAELSKTPRNVFLAIVGVLVLGTMIMVAMSFVGEEEESVELVPADLEAQSLIESGSMDLRAFSNNPSSGYSGNERADVKPFIDACYAAGARRLFAADIREANGERFAHAVVVELPETQTGAEAVRNAARDLLEGRASAVEVGNRWLVARFNP